ncbi:Protein_tyrosine kinase domain-containing protein [Hexamita inflata]|uniref:Protein_tyrosine kinase domain-containing protein n=1 Tax=Hexamita inflata TaxID=28002 RepID=A0ABP1IEH1_9EUKA
MKFDESSSLINLFQVIFQTPKNILTLETTLNQRQIWAIKYQDNASSFKIVLQFEQNAQNTAQLYYNGQFGRIRMNKLQADIKIREEYQHRFNEIFKVYLAVANFMNTDDSQLEYNPTPKINKKLIDWMQWTKQFVLPLDSLKAQTQLLLLQPHQIVQQQEYDNKPALMLEMEFALCSNPDSSQPQTYICKSTNMVDIIKKTVNTKQNETNQSKATIINEEQVQQIANCQNFIIKSLIQSIPLFSEQNQQSQCLYNLKSLKSAECSTIHLPDQITSLIQLLPHSYQYNNQSKTNYFQNQFNSQICIFSNDYTSFWKCVKKLEKLQFCVQTLYVPSAIYQTQYQDQISKLIQFKSQYSVNYVNHWIEIENFEENNISTIFLQSEYYTEQTLEDVFNNHLEVKMSQTELLQITSQILQGMNEMHSCGITHGNIKPQSILISNMNIKFFDFSIGNRYTFNGNDEINDIINQKFLLDNYFKEYTIAQKIQQDCMSVANVLKQLWMQNECQSSLEIISALEQGVGIPQLLLKYCFKLQTFGAFINNNEQNKDILLNMLIKPTDCKKRKHVQKQVIINEYLSKIQLKQSIANILAKNGILKIKLNNSIPFTTNFEQFKTNLLPLLYLGFNNEIQINCEHFPILNYIQLGLTNTIYNKQYKFDIYCGIVKNFSICYQIIQSICKQEYPQFKIFVSGKDCVTKQLKQINNSIIVDMPDLNQFLDQQFMIQQNNIVIATGGVLFDKWQLVLHTNQ